MQTTAPAITAGPPTSREDDSQRIRWDIDRDVIRGRTFDFGQKFLPDDMSMVDRLEFLAAPERRLLSQVQGRTYANMYGLVERVGGGKILELRRSRSKHDGALAALVRFANEKLKHREMFRRIEWLIAGGMRAGYRFVPHTDDVVEFVLGKSTWAGLALICHFEMVKCGHYSNSIARDAQLSDLFKDVLFFHWNEESQYPSLAKLEWLCEDSRLGASERDAAVNDLIELIQGVDMLLQFQAPEDVDYLVATCNRAFTAEQIDRLRAAVLSAYRRQYIGSGAQKPQFGMVLSKLVSAEQATRVGSELAPIMQ
jgi:hypothetical protein